MTSLRILTEMRMSSEAAQVRPRSSHEFLHIGSYTSSCVILQGGHAT